MQAVQHTPAVVEPERYSPFLGIQELAWAVQFVMMRDMHEPGQPLSRDASLLGGVLGDMFAADVDRVAWISLSEAVQSIIRTAHESGRQRDFDELALPTEIGTAP